MGKATTYGVVIVGAGHAGAGLACELRQHGYAGRVLLVSDEARPPYARPALSKACLLGNATLESLLFRKADFWMEAGIDLALGCKVDRLDAQRREAMLSDGRRIAFDWCVLATGGRAKTLSCPGSGLTGTFALRNFADMEGLRDALTTARNVVVIGGGYMGLEVAASVRTMGKAVSLVEIQQRVLSRVTSSAVSRFFEAAHRRNGVKLHLGRAVAEIQGRGQVEAVLLDDGTRIAADVVVVGIGIEAETSLAEQAGIACHEGVLVDSRFCSSAEGVLAIGDCARHPNDFAGGLWRLESVQHAQDSAVVAAHTILGEGAIYHDVPTFWSEQYDLRMQSAGIAKDAEDIVVRGDLDRGPFSILYLRDGRMIAIDTVNNSRDFLCARKLIGARAPIDRTRAGDLSVPLKAFA